MRPWATVLRAPTDGGNVLMKAAGPATAFEAGLYELRAREAPGDVLAPLAHDQDEPIGLATSKPRFSRARGIRPLGAAK